VLQIEQQTIFIIFMNTTQNYKEQELNSQNVRSLTPVRLVWNSLPADLRLEPNTVAVLNANLKVACFALFLLTAIFSFLM